MSNINICYLTDDALQTLYSNLDNVSQKIIDSPNSIEWLTKLVGSKPFITKKYYIKEFSLKVPTDYNDRSTDIENSISIYEHLKHLPAYVLSDERFWGWFNFTIGYQVAQKYMQIKADNSVFKDHWLFSQGKRRGLFFGVLSRCYYRVALTVDPTLTDPYEYTKFAIDYPERFRNLTWRTFSNEHFIVLGSLKAEKRILNEFKIVEKADYFTEIAKRISQLGSVKLLDAMTEQDIETFVYEEYKEIIKNDIKDQTLVAKILSSFSSKQ